MKIKYKLLAFVPVIMMSGCDYEAQVVVKEKSNNTLLVKDVESGKDKVIISTEKFNKSLEYVVPGDTIVCVSSSDPDGRWYKNQQVINLEYIYCKLRFNKDTIFARQQMQSKGSCSR